jgi:hypothetical protein
VVIDVWMEQPTLRFLGNDIFESLRRWTGQEVPDEQLPIDATVAAMDDAGVNFGLLSALVGTAPAAADQQRGGSRLGERPTHPSQRASSPSA